MASLRVQIMVLACFAITFGTLLINTNVMLSVRNTVNRERLGNLFRNELHHYMRDYPFHTHTAEQENVIEEGQPQPVKVVYVNKSTRLSTKLDNLDAVPFLFEKNFTPAYTLGKGRNKPTSVVIGVPSVKRTGGGYLFETLGSLFKNLYPVNEDKVTVVVFLAETDLNYVRSEAKKIYERFKREMDDGLLQVMSPPQDFYPNFNNLPQTLGDPSDRLKWRSKEVFDAAYLMFVCRNKAKYYLMLEDDVIAAKGYITAMEEFAAQHQTNDYIYLSFSTFNSIAKLFKASDVATWATYFFNFYGSKPIDWLMMDLIRMKACHPEMSEGQCSQARKDKTPQVSRGYFQHIGKSSSLVGKDQLIVDHGFSNDAIASNAHSNPPAKVSTSFKRNDRSTASTLYTDGGGMNKHFYVGSSSADGHVTVEFSTPQTIARILVKTGNADVKKKLIGKSGVVEVRRATDKHASSIRSHHYEVCAEFDMNGAAECNIGYQISMFRIRITRSLNSIWFDLIYVK